MSKKPKSTQVKSSRSKSKNFSFLKPGDIVDIVAPGSPCSEDHLQKAAVWLKAQGYQPRFPSDILAPDLFLANSDEKRFEYLMAALKAKDSKAVWCLRGGYGCIRLVPRLLKEKKPAQEKLFIGLSDITTLHLFLNQKWNWRSLHASLLDRVGQNKLSEQNKNELIGVIENKQNEVVFNSLKPLNAVAIKFQTQKKELVSQVLGGNLAVFCSSLGTPLQPKTKGRLIFFEDIGERGYKIDRLLEQISQAGLLKTCAGVIFGDFIDGNEADGKNYVWPVIEKFSHKLNVPVFSGVQTGHGDIQRPLFFNTKAKLACGDTTRMIVFSK